MTGEFLYVKVVRGGNNKGWITVNFDILAHKRSLEGSSSDWKEICVISNCSWGLYVSCFSIFYVKVKPVMSLALVNLVCPCPMSN